MNTQQPAQQLPKATVSSPYLQDGRSTAQAINPIVARYLQGRGMGLGTNLFKGFRGLGSTTTGPGSARSNSIAANPGGDKIAIASDKALYGMCLHPDVAIAVKEAAEPTMAKQAGKFKALGKAISTVLNPGGALKKVKRPGALGTTARTVGHTADLAAKASLGATGYTVGKSVYDGLQDVADQTNALKNEALTAIYGPAPKQLPPTTRSDILSAMGRAAWRGTPDALELGKLTLLQNLPGYEHNDAFSQFHGNVPRRILEDATRNALYRNVNDPKSGLAKVQDIIAMASPVSYGAKYLAFNRLGSPKPLNMKGILKDEARRALSNISGQEGNDPFAHLRGAVSAEGRSNIADIADSPFAKFYGDMAARAGQAGYKHLRGNTENYAKEYGTAAAKNPRNQIAALMALHHFANPPEPTATPQTSEFISGLKRNLATTGTGLGIQALNNLYMNQVLKGDGTQLTPEQLNQLIQEVAGPENQPNVTPYTVRNHTYVDNPYVDTLANPMQVVVNPRHHSGIARHEGGHVKEVRLLDQLGNKVGIPNQASEPLMVAARKLGDIGMAAAPFINQNPNSTRAALLASAGSIPTIASEVAASHFGGMAAARKAREIGTNPVKAYLSPYSGVPTYVTAALYPYLSNLAANAADKPK